MDASKRWQKHRVKAVCNFREVKAEVKVEKPIDEVLNLNLNLNLNLGVTRAS